MSLDSNGDTILSGLLLFRRQLYKLYPLWRFKSLYKSLVYRWSASMAQWF